MSMILWAHDPWGRSVPAHIDWSLLWISLAAGLAFLVLHALLALRSAAKAPVDELVSELPQELQNGLPPKISRHSPAARLFHWCMAAAVLTLLATGFLPRAGLPFNWINIHWLAGTVLLFAIAFHLVHAVCCMDFWSIWPGRADLAALRKRAENIRWATSCTIWPLWFAGCAWPQAAL